MPKKLHLLLSIFLLLSLFTSADGSTIARLSFWLVPEQMERFGDAYEEQLVPILRRHGLIESPERGRVGVDGVFSRLFAVESPAAVLAFEKALQSDPEFLQILQSLETTCGLIDSLTSFRLYRSPAGSGKKVAAGTGFRRGLWRSFGVEDGLGASSPSAILQDRDGYLWFGSSLGGGGTTRYDGAEFITFTVEDGLANDYVRAICQDVDGNLWFGTRNGVSRYDGAEFTTFTIEDGLPGNGISAIHQDADGHLWFGTDGVFGTGNGVGRFDGEQFVVFTIEDGLPDNTVSAICQDVDGYLWFGTGNGVSRYDGEQFVNFIVKDGLISTIYQDTDGYLWLGSWGDGVSRYDGNEFTTFTIENEIPSGSESVIAIHQDVDGYLWFGTFNGLSRYDGENFVNFTNEDGLGHNAISAICQDTDGFIWFGHVGGVSRYGGIQLAHFTAADGLPSSFVFDILEDRNGGLWFGTLDGVGHFDGTQFSRLQTRGDSIREPVYAILEDRHGVLWFSGKEKLSRYDGEALTTVASQPTSTPMGMLEDRNGDLWFTSSFVGQGVTRYDGEKFEHFDTGDGLAGEVVTDALEDRSGNLWFGMFLKGVSRYDGAKFENIDVDKGSTAEANSVVRILEDSSGNLWFTGIGSISCYDGETFTHFNTEDGLPSTSIISALEDRKGHLWFGSWGNGIRRYDGRVFQILDRRDGLPDNSIQDILQDRNGDIWIATEGGVARYRPSINPPVVRIGEVIADRSYGSVSEIRLPSTQEFVRFLFQSSSLTTSPARMIHLFRLHGFEEDWRQTKDSSIDYTDLPIGGYIFQVRAVDRDLNYSDPAEVRLVVHPPYRQIALAGGLALALIGLTFASGYGLRRRRDLRLAEQALMRELEEELQTAHNLQMELMPAAPPHIEGFDIAGRCLTANHVGGDFFQYFRKGDKLLICMADVTGHAMEAAIPVVMFSGILRTEMQYDPPLEQLLLRLNRTLCDTLDSRTFVCLVAAEFDLSDRSLELANAGCPYPYHFSVAGGEVTERQLDAYPLGVVADTAFSLAACDFQSDDYLILCSDGIVEAENESGELFGFDRTAETIRRGCLSGLSAEALIDHIIAETLSFTGDTPQGDDRTIVAVRLTN
jgi:ligand-binding sensor domain-containing protein